MELRGNELADGGVVQRVVAVGVLHAEGGAARTSSTAASAELHFLKGEEVDQLFRSPAHCSRATTTNARGGRGGHDEARTGRARDRSSRDGQRVGEIFVVAGCGSTFDFDNEHDIVELVFHEHVQVRANLSADGAGREW